MNTEETGLGGGSKCETNGCVCENEAFSMLFYYTANESWKNQKTFQ